MPSVTAVTRSPTKAQSVGGRANAWSGPSLVVLSDNVPTAALVSSSWTNTDLLWTSTYGFSIPTSAKVCGARATVEYQVASRNCLGRTTYIVSGVAVGTKTTAAFVATSGFDVNVLVGSSSSQPTPFTPAKINSDEFGVAIEFRTVVTGVNSIMYVDSVQLTLWYEEPSPAPEVRSAEFDHEMLSVAAIRNVAFTMQGGRSEYDHETTSVNLTRIAAISPQSSEYGTEIFNVWVGGQGDLFVVSYEEGFEIDSVDITQQQNLNVQSSEYDFSIDSPSLASFIASVDSAEFDHEIQQVNVALGTITAITPVSLEIGYEIKSVYWFDGNLRPDSLEFGSEIKSTYLTFGIVLDPTEGAEFDVEIGSIGLRRFFNAIAPTRRTVLVGQGTRIVDREIGVRVDEVAAESRRIVGREDNAEDRVGQVQLQFYRDLP